MSYENKKAKLTDTYPAIEDLARKAKKRLPKVSWEYLESGTGDENLISRNRRAFQAINFLPQFCKGELQANTETTLFGKKYAAPIGVAPVGLTGLMWPKAEQHLAASCARFNIPFCLSTLATATPETVGEHVGDMGWFQLYPPKDPEILASLLQRAKDSGYHTLVITADIPMPSLRERTKRAGMSMPPKITPKMIWEGITHPAWSLATLQNGIPSLKTVEHYTNNNSLKFVSGFVGNRLGGTLSWDYCTEIKKLWDGPVVIKGILNPKDAIQAIEAGMDGIWVSNHGARQFNGAATAIEALPAITEAVNSKVPIIFDSGVRNGLDIMRALYLGADFVFAGRPFFYGVAALGKYGGDHVANIFIEDLKNNMVQLGAAAIGEIRAGDLLGSEK